MRFKRILSSLVLAVLLLVSVSGTALASWVFAFPINVADTGATARTYVPVLTGITGSSLVDSGYITATGTDTNMQIGSTSVPFMLSTTQIATVVPTLGAGSQAGFNLYTGYSPVQTVFSIITGTDGYITVSDDADLELGDDFEIELSGYIDTSSGDDKNLVFKVGSVIIFISAAGEITASLMGEGSATYEELVPNAEGDYTNITSVSGASTHWEAVDDPPASPDDSGSFVYDSDTAENKDVYNLEDGSIPPDAVVTSVTVYYRFKTVSNPYSSTARPYLRLGTDETVGTQESDGSGSYVSKNETLARPGGGDWAFSDIEDLQVAIGLSKVPSATRTDCTQVYVRINYNSGLSVTVTDISSGEHTVKVYADGTDLGIIVDEGEAGEVSDTTLLDGASVPDNANDITINQNNVMPYFDYLKWTVSDTLIAWYQPVAMITATTLPDRQGDAENGTITWGENSDMTVTMGSVASYESTEAGAGEQEEISYTAPSPNIPSGWFGSGDETTLPFYDNFLGISAETGIPVKTIYIFMIFSVAMAMGFGTFIVFKPMIFGLVVTLAVLWAGSSMGIIPGWVIFSLIVVGFGVIYMRRQM